MKLYIEQLPVAQPVASWFVEALLAGVDAAEPADAKHMILTMYESGLLSEAEAVREISSRGLESA